ncbi:deubiquitinase OTUD6B-like [Homarus americanus]|uniref:Deubiquitinase OTUD6B-like n=1 Tax=Homarus americanus TaxID=6706 RepID=A0A8J5JVB8_HOMAM|nr:deubiquitinase OTUD6B-like [Homarus americanus]XP_042232527.1 deubiquitinase OTUD6B-like [Homarus americanus]XP_042232528.1 deubiquitinase OTUD6B-like [Homarus americanus]KAG7163061.1 Deubiquitinase OTUD6B-like [Homarus americanus]
MADETNGALLIEEELVATHRREKKELQACIQQLKKSANKDKKKKKEASDEIARMEKDLQDKHTQELAALKTSQQEVNVVSNGVDSLTLTDEDPGEPEEVDGDIECSQPGGKKLSKAEKRRQKKAEAIREREARIKEEEANNKYSARNIEAEKLKLLLRERKLKMHEIKPDGNCMYTAIAHQMEGNTTVPWLRLQAGQFIRQNNEAFAPFITDPKTGELLTLTQFADYCFQIENTPAWGGQPELRALSQVLQRKIEVLQAEGSPVIFGEEYTDKKTILLAYYRHYYGLGEHYNSVTALTPTAEEESR